MLEIRNLTITIIDKKIIDDLSFVLNAKDKLAIIGEEGNGKSTLLKAINNDLSYASVTGTINLKGHSIGYLKQNLDDELELSIYNYLFKSDEDYYNKINDLYKLIKKLNIKEELLEVKHIKYLSGGEKVKIALLKILLDDPDILLLDEPTNDLDIEALNWLEQFINSTEKPIIYVSHDETLLSRTANMILHLELIKKKTVAKNTVLKITYDEYVEKRLNSINKQTMLAKKEKENYDKKEQKLKQVMAKVHHEQETISRSAPHAAKMLKRKMKSLKNQEHKLENTELTETPDYEESINFFFNETFIPNNKDILKLDISELKIDNIVLSKNIKLEIRGPKKIAIIGENGVGKTTLIHHIYNELKDRTDIKVGYMPQNYDEVLKNYKTPIDFLAITHDKEETSKHRQFLGNMNFTSDEMISDISSLSGGSKAKLILLKLIINNYNVLVLDEPTRNVSPLSNPVIRESLINFNGAIISVSHDRKYLSTVVDTIYKLTNNGLTEIDNLEKS